MILIIPAFLAGLVSRVLASRVAAAAGSALSKSGMANILLAQAGGGGPTAPNAQLPVMRPKGSPPIKASDYFAQKMAGNGATPADSEEGGAPNVGKIATYGAALSGVFGILTLAGKKLADSQVDAQKSLVRFNGQIGMAFAKLERGDIVRARASGARTAGTTDALVGAVNEMRDALQPIKDVGTNILNIVGTGAAKVVTILAKGLKVITDIYWFFAGKPAAPPFNPWQQTVNDLAKMYRDQHDPNQRRKKQP